MIDILAEPIESEGNTMVISASAGIAIFPNDDLEIEELIRKSDEAMYYIKEHGRNGYRFYRDGEQLWFSKTSILDIHFWIMNSYVDWLSGIDMNVA